MPVQERCPTCSARMELPDKLRGKLVLCRCGEVVPVEMDEAAVRAAFAPPPRAAPSTAPANAARPPAAKRSALGTVLAVLTVVVVAPAVLCCGGGALFVYFGKGTLDRGLASLATTRATATEKATTGTAPAKQTSTEPEKRRDEIETFDDALAALRGDDRRQTAAARWLALRPVEARRRSEIAAALAGLLRGRPGPAAAALDALATWATPVTAPALVELLDTGCVGPAGKALAPKVIGVLAGLDDPRVPRVLAAQLARDHGDAARDALRKLGPKAADEVLPYFNDPSEPTRRRARSLAADLKVSDAVLLRRCVEDAAARSAGRTRSAADWLARARPDDAQRSTVARVLERFLEDPEPALVGTVAAGLVAWGDRDSVPPLAALVAAGRPEVGVRHRVIEHLGKSGDLRALRGLLPRLGSGEDEKAVADALRALGEPGEKELRRLALSGAEPALREAAFRALRGRPDAAALAVAISLDEVRSPDPLIRRTALLRLAGLSVVAERRVEVARAAEAALDDRDQQTRIAARQALAVWAIRDDVPRLIAMLRSGQETQEYAAIEVLGKLGDERAIVPLIDDICSGRGLRVTTERSLAAFGSRAEKEVLGRLKGGETRGRRELIRMLGGVGTKENALPYLIELEKELQKAGDRELATTVFYAIQNLRMRNP